MVIWLLVFQKGNRWQILAPLLWRHSSPESGELKALSFGVPISFLRAGSDLESRKMK